LRNAEKGVDESARSIGEEKNTADYLSQRILGLGNGLQAGKHGSTQLEAERTEMKLKSEDQEQPIRDYKLLTKKLRNEVQVLKRDIRVFCRMRFTRREFRHLHS